jgi:hypothetical protein
MLKNAILIPSMAPKSRNSRLAGRIMDSRRYEAQAMTLAKRARGASFIGTAFSLFVLLMVVLGVIVAACSGEPVVWMLRWPAPLVVTFTVFNFIRQGYHKRDGLLVLGPATEREPDGGDEVPGDSSAVSERSATEHVPDRQIVRRASGPRTRQFRALASLAAVELP